MFITPSGISICCKLMQPLKAYIPMLSTVPGIETEVRFGSLIKAP